MGLEDIDEEAPPPRAGAHRPAASPAAVRPVVSATAATRAMDDLFGDIGVSATTPSPAQSSVSPAVPSSASSFPSVPRVSPPAAQRDAFDDFFASAPAPVPSRQQPEAFGRPHAANSGSESPSLLDLSQPQQRCANDFLDGFLGKPARAAHSTSPPVGGRSLSEMTSGERPYVPPQPLQDKMNFYEALGLKSTASVEEVRKAYRGKALHLHPDKNTNRTADETSMFNLLTRAQEVLSDEEKRQEYDGKLNQARASQMASENWLFHMK
jgi:hypothetical protein